MAEAEIRPYMPGAHLVNDNTLQITCLDPEGAQRSAKVLAQELETGIILCPNCRRQVGVRAMIRAVNVDQLAGELPPIVVRSCPAHPELCKIEGLSPRRDLDSDQVLELIRQLLSWNRARSKMPGDASRN